VETAFALFSLALIERNVRAAEQSLALYRDLGDPWGTAFLLCTLGYCISEEPTNYEQVRDLCLEALSISLAQGDRINAAHASHGLATHALYRGELGEAEKLARQALDLFEAIGDRLRAAWVYDTLSTVTMVRGRFAEARAQIQKGAELYEDMGGTEGIAQAAFLLGTYEMHLGQFAQAHRCGERVLALWSGGKAHQMSALLLLASVALVERDYAQARGLLQGQDLTIAYDKTGRHQLDHLPAILAHALRGLGQPDLARRYLLTALRLVPQSQVFWPLMYSLVTYALLLVDEGEMERAVELYSLTSRYPFVANSRWFEAVAGEDIAAVAATLPPHTVAVAQERGRARDLDATVKELLVELETEMHNEKREMARNGR
jgi:tetratricopeptide (TPR) repeat protein